MRSAIIAAAAVCLVLVGCSSEGSSGSDGKAGTSGTAGSNGAAGAAGQNGAAGAQGPIGPAGPKGDKGDPGSAGASATSSKNGTRIKVLRTSETTADGMEVVSVGGYVDTARGDERCIAFPSGDGTLRCVPTVYPQAVAGSIVWDNTCTTPLVLTTAILTGSTKYVYAGEVVNNETRYRVFVTTPSPSTTVCNKGIGGGCTCRNRGTDDSLYQGEVAPTDFAAITRTYSTL